MKEHDIDFFVIMIILNNYKNKHKNMKNNVAQNKHKKRTNTHRESAWSKIDFKSEKRIWFIVKEAKEVNSKKKNTLHPSQISS